MPFVMALPGPAANFTNSFSSLPYKPLTDFDHVSQITYRILGIIARKNFPGQYVAELIAYAKGNPGKVMSVTTVLARTDT